MAVEEFGSTDYVDLNLYDDRDIPIIDNPLHLFLQEIEICVKTLPGSIWGIIDGVSLYKYVFNQYITINQIRNDLNYYIQKNCAHASQFNYDISTDVISVENKHLIYITMTIESENPVTGEVERYLQKFVLG